jgi:hypothetical protein
MPPDDPALTATQSRCHASSRQIWRRYPDGLPRMAISSPGGSQARTGVHGGPSEDGLFMLLSKPEPGRERLHHGCRRTPPGTPRPHCSATTLSRSNATAPATVNTTSASRPGPATSPTASSSAQPPGITLADPSEDQPLTSGTGPSRPGSGQAGSHRPAQSGSLPGSPRRPRTCGASS